MKNKTKYILCIGFFIISLLLFLTNSILVEYYNFPWWTLIISETILIFSIIVLCFIYFKNTEFICPHCNTQFKPKTSKAIMAPHFGNIRLLTCPNCNKKGWCKDIFIEKENTLKSEETTNK